MTPHIIIVPAAEPTTGLGAVVLIACAVITVAAAVWLFVADWRRRRKERTK